MFSMQAIIVFLPLMIWNLVLGSDVTTAVNCAACQYLDGPWNSWECRVQCNVAPQGVQIMGSVDAFAARLGPRDSGKQYVSHDKIFVFDVVNVNIRGGYNSTTGKFTVTIAGVYKVGLYVFAPFSNKRKLNMMVKKAAGNEEKHVCSAHSDADIHRAASCGTLLQLEEGDELYARGYESGSLHSPAYFGHSSLEAHLLYKASP